MYNMLLLDTESLFLPSCNFTPDKPSWTVIRLFMYLVAISGCSTIYQYLQWCQIEKQQSLLKSLGLWSPNRYEIDLSNEVLNIDFSQEAAKISVKVGVKKRYLSISQVRTPMHGFGRVGRYFFRTPTLTSDIFAVPQSKSMFSTSFERSISYLYGK